uniref:Uncharacterized protein n=1 Tax=Tanacetum cinerariifolium TaxID=118510 RepID=A0A6L2JPR7_TANCI|nr:hypothetical protein [Tanacetum cinerariifolium]
MCPDHLHVGGNERLILSLIFMPYKCILDFEDSYKQCHSQRFVKLLTALKVYEIDTKLRHPKVMGSWSLLAMLVREKNLQTYSCALIPNVEQNFMLNWASFGVGYKCAYDAPDFTIFSVRGAKVVTEDYGLVKFKDETE